VSTGAPNSEPEESSADEPAPLVPDEATAIHDVPDPIPAVLGVGEPAAAEEIAAPGPVAPEPPSVPSAAAPPPAVVPPPPPPVAEPDEPLVTSSGLPNPHGLPEVAVERPEVAVGAAFAGGIVLAMILKRFAR
jgi:hypothetical protein